MKCHGAPVPWLVSRTPVGITGNFWIARIVKKITADNYHLVNIKIQSNFQEINLFFRHQRHLCSILINLCELYHAFIVQSI